MQMYLKIQSDNSFWQKSNLSSREFCTATGSMRSTHHSPTLVTCQQLAKRSINQTWPLFLTKLFVCSHPRDSEETTNEEEANFDFLQNEGEDENVNEEDDADDGGNADDESDDRDDDRKERRVLKKPKQGTALSMIHQPVNMDRDSSWCPSSGIASGAGTSVGELSPCGNLPC